MGRFLFLTVFSQFIVNLRYEKVCIDIFLLPPFVNFHF